MNRRGFLKRLAGAATAAIVPLDFGADPLPFTPMSYSVTDAYGITIDAGGASIAEVYETVKYLTRRKDSK